MKHTHCFFFAAVMVMASATRLAAGGFWLESGNPEANAEARAANAVVVIRAVGCHDPDKAEVSGTAIGYVNGERRSVPLKLVKLSSPGAYAVAPQWPAAGKWALQFIGNNNGVLTSIVFPVVDQKVQRLEAKQQPRVPTEEELTALLKR